MCALPEATGTPASAATSSHTEQAVSTRRLVIDSQRGTGMYSVECEGCY